MIRKITFFSVLSGLVLAATLAQGCKDGAGTEVPDQSSSSAMPQQGTAVPALQKYDIGGNFTLTDQNGQPFELSQLHGKVALLYFGYTLCPDACPATLARLTRAYKLLGPQARDNVVTLFISVDSGRDKPQKMKEYLDYFDVNAVGLTGTRSQIDPVVAQYGAKYEITDSGSAAGYLVNHSTSLFLIDQHGEVRYVFKHKDPPELIAAGVRQLLPARS